MQHRRRAPLSWLAVLAIFTTLISGSAPTFAQTVEPGQTIQLDQPPAEATATQPAVAPTNPPGEPSATTVPEEPTATNAPAEPTATDQLASTEPSATEIVTPTVADDNLSSLAVPVNSLNIHIEECTDASRVGVTDFFFSGEVAAAGEIGADCHSIQYVNIGSGNNVIQVTLNSDTQSYFGLADANGNVFLEPGPLQPGIYSVAVLAGEDYTAVMQGTITLAAAGFYDLRIVRYVAGAAPQGPGGDGFGNVNGQYRACLDPARANTVDLVLLQAADVASECQFVQLGQAMLRLQGDTFDGRTVDQTVPVDPGSNFSFFSVPFGTYTITDVATGAVSEPFPVGGSAGADVSLTLYSYFAEEPPLFGTVTVQKIVCVDPDRVNDVEFVITRQQDATGPFAAAESCFNLPSVPVVPQLTLTLEGTAFTQSQPVIIAGQQVQFLGVPAGSYILSESDGIDTLGTSASFDLASGETLPIQVINYVAGEPTNNPGGVSNGSVTGHVRFCTSIDRNGEVDFLINNTAFFPADAGTSTCSYAGANQVEIELAYFGNGTDPAATPSQTYRTSTNSDGSYGFGFVFPIGSMLAPGWYQVTLSDSSFASQAFSSEMFTLSSGGGGFPFGNLTTVDILAYVAPAGGVGINVIKSICYDAARNEETDFFINQYPEGDVSGAATTECTPGNYPDGTTLQFTLTNTETGDTADSIVFTSSFPFMFTRYSFVGVPAGTYTLTETVAGPAPDNVTRLAISDPFTIDPALGDYQIFVKNYTADQAPDAPTEGTTSFAIEALTCLDDTRAGDFDYFVEQSVILLPPLTVGQTGISASATGTGVCQAGLDGQYAFQLESVPADESAPMIYTLTPVPGQPYRFTYDSSVAGELLPAGTYVVRETMTDSVSEPVTVDIFGRFAQFYYYVAAPTPTPLPTETPESPATLVAGDVTLTVAAGETITGNLNDLVTGGVPPYSFAVLVEPTQGTVTVNPNGTFTYTANADATGTDSFEYTVTDSQQEAVVSSAATASGTVSIIIAAPGETPGTTPGTTPGVTPTVNTGTVQPGEPGPGVHTPAATSTPQGNGGQNPVTSLPSTGQGSGGNTSSTALLMLLLIGVALLGAAGIMLHRRSGS